MNLLVIAFVAVTFSYALLWHNRTAGPKDEDSPKTEDPEKHNEL
jgi:hypothetical protein